MIMKVVCIMQARVGSTRLPGKVLKKICGKTVLEHDIDRLKRVKNIEQIVIATTTLERDNAIVEEAKRLGVDYFRGSEEDVLSRYYYAAKENEADVVVRVTSDCPLIDPQVTEKVIKFYLENKYDYVNNTIVKSFPRGLDTEVFNFQSLKKAFLEATTLRDREHVTPYIWDNPTIFNLGCFVNDKDYSYLRWTLDTPEDFELISEIYKYLYSDNQCFGMKDIVELYSKHSELLNVNKDIKQKEV